MTVRMSTYNTIKRYYFTGCIVLLLLLTLPNALRNGWHIPLRTMLATLCVWFVLCAATIGVIFLVFNKRNNGHDSRGGR